MRTLLVTLNAKYIHSSLALRYLKYYIKEKAGFNADILEFSINNNILEMLQDIYSYKPEIIGFACYIWNIEMTRQLISLIKSVMPEVKIICGGPEVSYEPESLMMIDKNIDYIISGEGEKPFLSLLTKIYNNDKLSLEPGIVFIDDAKVVNGGIYTLDNLNELIFPYNEEEISSSKDKIIYYESSRGCPFSCQYCLSSATVGVRFLNVRRVIDELKFFVGQKVKQVKFVDRTFNVNKKHFMPILKFIAEQECETNFHFEVSADLLDADVFELLKTMPKQRVQLEVGVQSTNEKTLQAINRTHDFKKIEENVVELLKFNNIHLHLDLIIGLPYEDVKTFAKSFNDVYNLKPHALQLGFLKILKGSKIFYDKEQHEYCYMSVAPYQVLKNKYLTYEETCHLIILEDLFEKIYNAGRLKNLESYLIKNYYKNSAFNFYNELTVYWQEQNLHRIALSVKSLYENIFSFCKEQFQGNIAIISELFKFDLLKYDNKNINLKFLKWNNEEYNEEIIAFWRNEEKVIKYIPEYVFATWREIKNKYHIEVFRDLDSVDGIKACDTEMLIVLFMLEDNSVKVITREDFYGK